MTMMNCNMFCYMKNGQKWIHTSRGDEFPVEGFGSEKEDFLEEDVRKIVFKKADDLGDGDLVSVVVDFGRDEGYENVEEMEFSGVKYAFITKKMTSLKKVTLGEELVGFDLGSLRQCGGLEEIEFPKNYWNIDFNFLSASKKENFPATWSKELKFNIIAHFPKLISRLDFVPTQSECEALYTNIFEEMQKRADERAKTEKKSDVLKSETENLHEVQTWLRANSNKTQSLGESLLDVANSNGFKVIKK